MTRRVLVIARSYEESDSGTKRLRDAGYEVVTPPEGADLSHEALLRAVADVDGAIVGTQKFDQSVLIADGRMRAIVKAGVGIDNIDLDAAKKAGIQVAAVPGANAGAVAEYSIALMLAVGKRICEVNASVRSGKWGRFRGNDLTGATVGVIGLGHVGQGVCQRLKGFDVRLLGYDVVVNDEFVKTSGITVTTVETIAAESDFISLHAPLTDDTHHMVNRELLATMKPTAVLINTARGELIDTDALYEALSSNALAGAGLDVFETEPFRDERFSALDNIVLSSHNASYSNDGIARTVVAAADKMIELFSTQ